MGMRYELLKRERVLHEDRTEIVPSPKYLKAVLRSMEFTKFQCGTNTKCSWIRQVEA